MNQLVPNNIQPLRRKLYDLFAAAPLIAMYLFSLTQMLSPLALQIELAKLFIQTDPSVLPPDLVLDIVSKMCTMVFFALLVVMFAVRRVPLHYPIAFYPRFVAGAGTFLGLGILMLEPQQISEGLYLISMLFDYWRHRVCNLGYPHARSFDQYYAGGAGTGSFGALCFCPSPTLSWRVCCIIWDCSAAFNAVVAAATGRPMHIPIRAHEKRGTRVSSSLSKLCRLHGAYGTAVTRRLLNYAVTARIGPTCIESTDPPRCSDFRYAACNQRGHRPAGRPAV